MGPLACPPLELFLDELGRRCIPISSLRHVIEWQLSAAPEDASLELLLEAVRGAEEGPLPGHPGRADLVPDTIPGFDMAAADTFWGHLIHNDIQGEIPPCRNCLGNITHAPWCPVGPGRPVDPLRR